MSTNRERNQFTIFAARRVWNRALFDARRRERFRHRVPMPGGYIGPDARAAILAQPDPINRSER